MDSSIYFHSIQVSSKDCAKDQTIKLPDLLDHMQEAAWKNATALGFSTIDLMKQNITWVMNRMRLEVRRMPVHLEHIKLETWPSGMDKYFTKRDFRVWSATDELLVEAVSNWLVMDIHTRKLIAIPEYIRAANFIVDRNNLPEIEGKLKYEPEHTSTTYSIPVSWFDLDINDHVNNTKYYQWILDGLGGSFLDAHRLKGMDIVFKIEGKYGDEFASNAYFDEAELCWSHALNHSKNGQTHVLAKSWFEKN